VYRSVVILCTDDDGAGRERHVPTTWLDCVTTVLNRLRDIPTAKVWLVTSDASGSAVNVHDGVTQLVLPNDVSLSHVEVARQLLTTVM
jgi:hypothetical protein